MCYVVAGDYALQQSVLSQQGTGAKANIMLFHARIPCKIASSLTCSKVNNYVKTVLLPPTAFTESKFYL